MQSQSKFHASAFFTALMFGFMYLPIAVLTFYSFNEAPNSAQWKGFTFSWYIKFFQDGRILSALWDSVLVASLAKKQGAAILLVTHDNRILDIADRIINMEDGRLTSLEVSPA